MGKRFLSFIFIASFIFFTSCKSQQRKGGGGEGPGGGGGGPKGGGGAPQAKQDRDRNGVNDQDEGSGAAPFSQQPAQNGLNNSGTLGGFNGGAVPGLGPQDTLPGGGTVNPSTDQSGIGGLPSHSNPTNPVDTQPDGQQRPSEPGLDSQTAATAQPTPTPTPTRTASGGTSLQGLLGTIGGRVQQGVINFFSPFGNKSTSKE